MRADRTWLPHPDEKTLYNGVNFEICRWGLDKGLARPDVLLSPAAKSLKIELDKYTLPISDLKKLEMLDWLENNKPLLKWKDNGPIRLEVISSMVD